MAQSDCGCGASVRCGGPGAGAPAGRRFPEHMRSAFQGERHAAAVAAAPEWVVAYVGRAS